MKKADWQHYLSRPHSLFTASLWHEWYASAFLKETIGSNMPNSLFIEDTKGIVTMFKISTQIYRYHKRMRDLITKNQAKIKKLLRNGQNLQREAEKIVLKGPQFIQLEKSVDFLIQLGLLTAELPRLVLEFTTKQEKADQALISKAKSLRKTTIYPRFISRVVIPLALKKLKRANKKLNQKDLFLLTYRELLNNQLNEIESRLINRKKKKLFTYEATLGKEKISWAKSRKLTQALNRLHLPIEGTSAFPGFKTGKVRTETANFANFRQGDILVSISASPKFLPYIRKSGAIITDEGGLGCHAAIVSRELGIPCIIGTKIATKVFKDGDMVEVDANRGIVRKIK